MGVHFITLRHFRLNHSSCNGYLSHHHPHSSHSVYTDMHRCISTEPWTPTRLAAVSVVWDHAGAYSRATAPFLVTKCQHFLRDLACIQQLSGILKHISYSATHSTKNLAIPSLLLPTLSKLGRCFGNFCYLPDNCTFRPPLTACLRCLATLIEISQRRWDLDGQPPTRSPDTLDWIVNKESKKSTLSDWSNCQLLTSF